MVPADEAQLRAALRELGELLDRADPRVVALGETGLDRGRGRTDAHLALQRHALEAQLALARELDLPVVLHVVRAHAELLKSLRRVGLPRAGLQVHGFWGTTELVAAWGRIGAHLSIGRMVNRHPHARRAAAIAAIPGNRLLVETDSSSQGSAGTGDVAVEDGDQRPTDVWKVVQAVATIRAERTDDVALQTAENARRLFGLDRASLTPA
jgi:TatD DNase family protein